MATTVENRPDRGRYEIRVDGALAAFTAYELHGPRTAFTHTETEAGFDGQGLASQLIREALDDVRAHDGSVLPYCPFVRAFIERHPEYLELVPQAFRARFRLADD
jgi:uncharacterized protein